MRVTADALTPRAAQIEGHDFRTRCTSNSRLARSRFFLRLSHHRDVEADQESSGRGYFPADGPGTKKGRTRDESGQKLAKYVYRLRGREGPNVGSPPLTHDRALTILPRNTVPVKTLKGLFPFIHFWKITLRNTLFTVTRGCAVRRHPRGVPKR